MQNTLTQRCKSTKRQEHIFTKEPGAELWDADHQPLLPWAHTLAKLTGRLSGQRQMVEEGARLGWPAHAGLAFWNLVAFSAALLCPATEGDASGACLVVSSAAWAQGSASRRVGLGWEEQRALAFLSRAWEPARSSLPSKHGSLPPSW